MLFLDLTSARFTIGTENHINRQSTRFEIARNHIQKMGGSSTKEDSSSTKGDSRVTLTLVREEVTTNHHTDGSRTEQKKKLNFDLSAPDPESFQRNLENAKAIGYK